MLLVRNDEVIALFVGVCGVLIFYRFCFKILKHVSLLHFVILEFSILLTQKMLVYSKEIFSDFRSLVLLFKLQVLEIEDIENEQDLLAIAGQLLFYLEHAVPLGYAPLVLDR